MRTIRSQSRSERVLRAPPSTSRSSLFRLASLLACSFIFLLAGRAQAQTTQFIFDSPGTLVVQTSELVAAPQILGQPQDQIVVPGNSASFSIVVAATRGLSYQWYFNGTRIPVGT